MTRPGRRDEGGGYPHREITAAVIAAAIRVQQHLGPGLLERVYKDCLAHGLGQDGHGVQQDVRLDITYEGLRVPNAFSMDLVVDDQVAAPGVEARHTMPMGLKAPPNRPSRIRARALGGRVKFEFNS